MKTETIQYVCDLTGKPCAPMSETEHSATLRFDFGYGSRLDGAHGEFHLSAIAAEEVWAPSRLSRSSSNAAHFSTPTRR